jgi:predicted bacteriocin transport accessory protein
MIGGCDSSKKPIEITLKKAEEMIDNKETFVVEIMTDTCSACASFKPTVEELVKNYKVTFYYVNFNNESTEARQAFADNYANGIEVTPTILIYKEGVLVQKKSGTLTYRNLKTLLQENGFIAADE